MTSPKFIRTAVALALIGGLGFAQAQSPATSTTEKQNVKPMASGMTEKSKPTVAQMNTPSAVSSTVQPSSGGTPVATSTSPPDTMAKPRKAKRMKKAQSKTAAENVGSGSAGTAEGRVSGSTNSNSMGEPAKKP